MSNDMDEWKITPAGGGQVKSVTGAGVSTTFLTPSEVAQGKMEEMKLEAMQRGIQIANTRTNGVQQFPGIIGK